jgi:FtsP/CotA-like multicopper oxidase with cupredoxin domain
MAAGAVPNIQSHAGRVNEGQTVLTNGENVGHRDGDPAAPGGFPGAFSAVDVQPGQGLRLQIGDTATTRFFRLRLTDSAGNFIPLVRVGGEGGLLDDAVLDGTSAGGFDFKFPEGEVLLGPGDRADVVAAIPDTASGVATLWTQDFQRTGGGDGASGWARIPTVPVAHFNVTGSAVSPAFTISAGTALRSATGDPQEVLPASTGILLDPGAFVPPKPGMPSQDIRLTANGGFPSIDGIQGAHDFSIDYAAQEHDASARWGELSDVLQLTVTNATAATHPFHLHGFSIQPLSFTSCTDNSGVPLPIDNFTFPEPEFMDNLNVPGKCTLTFRVRVEDRPLVDGTTGGGGVGRWVFHCHIFFHHHQGMTSEFVVVDTATGNERPYVDADEESVTVAEGSSATMTGTYSDPDGDAVTLSASVGTVTDNGGGTWSWEYTPPDGPLVSMVFITATATGGTGQTAFALQADNVPPTVTIDPAQVMAIDEGDTLSVAATFTDPGEDEPYTATIDYGDGSGPQPVVPVVTNPTPPQSGTVAGSFQYGDNGTFHVTVTVLDKDGAPGSAAFDVTVANVDPDMDDIPTTFADAGDVVPFSTQVTDPGSDDLTLLWVWDDGTPDTVQVSLVNPPDPDPLVSPSVQPRDETFATSHAFAEVCLYDVAFSVLDDDGGTDAETVAVIITGTPTKSRSSGYWQTAYKGTGGAGFSQAQLQCFLDITGFLSTVFNETRDASTVPLAYDVMWLGGNQGDLRQKVDRELLTAWLNFANGAVEYSALIDTDKNGVPDTAFSDVMANAEAVRNNLASTNAQLQDQRNILQHINGG